MCGSGALSEFPRGGVRPLNMNSKRKYLSRSFRLSNNNITDLHGLQYTLEHFLARPSRLGWLDLSFNKLTRVEPVRPRSFFRLLTPSTGVESDYLLQSDLCDSPASVFQVLCELHELRVLYLHGNCIWELSQVDKLGTLQHLHTITLHGNAIETTSHYRLGTSKPVHSVQYSFPCLSVTRQIIWLSDYTHGLMSELSLAPAPAGSAQLQSPPSEV